MSVSSSGRGPPYCIAIYVELFSHEVLRRRPVGAILGRWFQNASLEAWPFLHFGGKTLRRMDEGEIPDNGNIYKLLSHHSLAKWRKMGEFMDDFHSCVFSQSPLPLPSAQAPVVSECVEINFPRLAENGRHASSCCLAVWGEASPRPRSWLSDDPWASLQTGGQKVKLSQPVGH